MSDADRSLQVFGWLVPLSRIHLWIPVFFLYLNERFTIEEVLQLESIYYLAVFALEVPSGYWSDRFGRVRTLRIGAASALLSYLLFLLARDSFWGVAAAEIALAFAWSFRSGTEAAFHYDTLEAAGREHEFGEREAAIASRSFAVAAVGAISGGVLGSVDLAWPYAVNAAVAVLVLGLCVALREPPRRGDAVVELAFFSQLGDCVRRLRDPLLLWIFAFVVIKTTTEHIPYTFGQPYLAAVFGESAGAIERTPLLAGLMVAGWQTVGSLVARRAMWFPERFGVPGAVLVVSALQFVLIACLAIAIHPVIAALLLLRAVQAAVGNVVVTATVTPRVPQLQRATFLSLHSLAGRLGYAIVLLGLGRLALEVDPVQDLQRMLGAGALIAGIGLLLLAWTRPRTPEGGERAPDYS